MAAFGSIKMVYENKICIERSLELIPRFGNEALILNIVVPNCSGFHYV